jgi:transposase InsO family protein
VKFHFIDAEKARFPVGFMCNELGVSRSGYYASRRRGPSERAKDEVLLVKQIKAVFTKSRTTYGSPRVQVELKSVGRSASRKRIARLMKTHGLVARCRKRFRRTTNSKHEFPVAENVLAREFTATAPDKAWVTDITYVWTREGWLYLAAILDVFSRRVVGWGMSERIDRQLCLDALQMAVRARSPKPGLIHHSDRGSQYASHDYRRALKKHEMVCSMSRKGDCWDNAVAESFWSTIKSELIDGTDYKSRKEARTSIFEFIEVFYNKERLHSHLGYLSPEKYEKMKEAA